MNEIRWLYSQLTDEDSHFAEAMARISCLLKVRGGMRIDEISMRLRSNGFPEEIIEEAIDLLRNR